MKKTTLTKKITAITLVLMLLVGLVPTVALPVAAEFAIPEGAVELTDENADAFVWTGVPATYDPAVGWIGNEGTYFQLDLSAGDTVYYELSGEPGYVSLSEASGAISVGDNSNSLFGSLTVEADAYYSFITQNNVTVKAYLVEAGSGSVPEATPEVIYLDIAGSGIEDGWVAIHLYDTNGSYVTGDSSLMTLVEGTVYSYTVPENAVTVFFADGPGSIMSEELTIPTDGTNLYTFTTGEWSTYVPSEPELTVPEVIYLDIEGSGIGAGEAYIHFFDASEDYVTDGTVLMTLVEGTVYSYTVPEDAVTVLFSNATCSIISEELTIPTDGTDLYTFTTGEWSTYVPSETELTVPEVIYLDIEGTDADPEGIAIHFYDAVGRYLSSDTMDLVEGTIRSCNVPDGTEAVYFAHLSGPSYTEDLILPTNGTNLYILATGEWSTYVPSETELTVPEVIYLDIAGSGIGAGEACVHFFDASWDYVTDGSVLMTLVEGTVYSYTVPENAVTVSFSNASTGIRSERITIPTDGTDLYTFATGEWSTYVPSVPETEPVAWNDTDDDGVIDDGETAYTDLEAALLAGGEVKLAKDVDITTDIHLSDITVTLDLNGYKITFSYTCLIAMGANAYLTVLDSSTENTGAITPSGSTSEDVFIVDGDSAVLSVYSGTFTAGVYDVVYAINGALNVYGGTYITNGSVAGLCEVNNSSTVLIYGGSFDIDPSDYVADGYEATYNESTGYYDVAEDSGSESIGKIVIEMTDTYGDGWNGANISVYKNGELIAEATVDGGYDNVLELDYDSEAQYEFFWTSGSYDNECSYTIFIDGVEYTEELLPNPYVPNITDISFNSDSPAYNEGDNTFTIDENNPLILTVTGENLKYLVENYNTSLQSIAVRLEENYRILDIANLIQDYSSTQIILCIDLDAIKTLYEEGTKPLGFGYTNNGATVSDFLLTATYEGDTVSIGETDNGEIELGSDSAHLGDTITVTVTPDEGYAVETVTAIGPDGELEVADNGLNVYSFKMPDGEVTVNVTYREVEKYTVTVSDGIENGSITVNVTEAYEGSLVTVSVTPDLGYRLYTVTVSYGEGQTFSASEVSDTECAFLMPAAGVTITASFEESPTITDMYVPEGTPGYDPVTKEFVVTPNHPFLFVMEGLAFDKIPDNWYILLGGLNNNTAVGGPINYTAESVTDTKITFNFGLDAFSHVLYLIDGSYVGKSVDYSYEQQLSDVKLYYSYVTVKQSENGRIHVPHSLNPGDTAVITVTPNGGYVLDTLTVTDANGEPVEVVDNSFTVPEGGATVTATFKAAECEWNGGVITAHATCSSDGIITYTCVFDDTHTYTEIIPANPEAHYFARSEVTKPATADEEGIRTYFCEYNEAHTYCESIPKIENTETDPVETDPVETDPVETDPVETDPIETDPVETDPVETDPVETDPVETDPVETDPVETDPVETDPVETEPKGDADSESDTEPKADRVIGCQGCRSSASAIGIVLAVIIGISAIFVKKKED